MRKCPVGSENAAEIQSTQEHLVPAWQRQPACHPWAASLPLCSSLSARSPPLYHCCTDTLCLILSYFSATAEPPCSCFFAPISTQKNSRCEKREISLVVTLYLTYWQNRRWLWCSHSVCSWVTKWHMRDVTVRVAWAAMECGDNDSAISGCGWILWCKSQITSHI